MLEQQATVVAIEEGFVWVETQRQNSCGHCSAHSGCGTATLGKVMGNRVTRVRAVNSLPLDLGEQVIVGLPEQVFVIGSLIIYLLPLVGLFLGAGLVQFGLGRHGAEWLTALGGVAGLMLALLWMRRFSHRFTIQYLPVVLRSVVQQIKYKPQHFSDKTMD